MILDVFANDTIIRERYPLVEDHGNLEPDRTAEPAKVTIDGCSAQPGASDEVLANRTATLIQWTVYAPSGVDVLSTDDVRYRGILYSVDGEPAREDNALGLLDHTVILLKTWEG